ncbi:MAG: DUF4097 domain-containing protein [Coriobacteriales bacterium]|jgi:hypothetical protein|nr:DUF4097 domain-containing protein [Coriobacteriales bacterium]
MSKATRNLLLVAGALILIGAILGGTGYWMGGMKAVRLTGGGPVVIDSASGFLNAVDRQWEDLDGLDIDVDLLELSMVEGDAFSLTGSYDPGLTDFDISEEKGVLVIRSTDRHTPWWGFGQWGFGLPFGGIYEPKMVFTYPKGTRFEDVSVKSSLGSFHMEGLRAERLAVALDLGNLTGQDIAVEAFDARMSLGNCELDRLEVAKGAEIHMDGGNLRLDDAAIAGLSSTSNLGNFDFSGVLSGTADIAMDLGALDMALGIPENRIAYSIECDLGSSTLNGRHLGSSAHSNVASPELTLEVRTNLGSVEIRAD